jgi:predicted DNA binding CopG/RHH family protein
MKKEYDFSKMQGHKNPYARKLKRQVTLRLSVEAVDYFKKLAQTTGIPYQNLINLYLCECAALHKKLTLKWAC